MWKGKEIILPALGLSLAGSVIGTDDVHGQSVFLSRNDESLVTFELTKVEFDGGSDISAVTSASFIGFRVPLSTGATFVADLPVAVFDADGVDAEIAVGNPFVGVEVPLGTEQVSFRLGGRLPVAPENNTATIVGLYDRVERLGSWLTRSVPVQGIFSYQNWNRVTGLVIRFAAGPELWIPTEDGVDSDVVALYNAQFGYATEQFTLMGGFGGLLVLSEEDANLGERSLHQATVSISLLTGNVRPGIHLRLPLDEDMTDTVDYGIGLNVAVVLPRR